MQMPRIINGNFQKLIEKTYYYFRYTTKGCKAFDKIDRNDKDKNFIITKNHTINYYNQIYNLKKYMLKIY